MATINNVKLLNKVRTLFSEDIRDKEHMIKNTVQIAFLWDVFDMKDNEHKKPKSRFKDYEREQVKTNDDIKSEFQKSIDLYHEFYGVAKDRDLVECFFYRMLYTIEVVELFNSKLAEELKQLARDNNVSYTLYI